MLKQYRVKRHFSRTREPRGSTTPRVKKNGGPLHFVVQKHHASHLHYDFRLEVGGVLKSWAIPKGPSLDPREKRLAVRVEDHPLEYRTFQGTIPKGEYGAGTVSIWDQGTFHAPEASEPAATEKLVKDGLKKGLLSFVMNGRRLKGEFHLIRMPRGGKENWLLIKKRDRFAKTGGKPAGRAERAKAAEPEREVASALAREKKPSVKRKLTSVTTLVRPMLATLVDEPFDRPGWIFEQKYDGYRAVADVRHGEVSLYSRSHKSFNEKFPELLPTLQRIGHDVILDGEIVVTDRDGQPRFQCLQNYPRTHEGTLHYYVFDLLSLDGHDLRDLPLLRRKETLREILPESSNVHYSDHIRDDGKAFFEAMRGRGVEGMVAKDGTSPYREGNRSGEWVKVKTHLRQEAVIGGFTAPKGAREKFGALLLGLYDQGKLVFVGRTGTGFDRKTLGLVYRRLKPLVQKASPFDEGSPKGEAITWVKPKLVAEVSFQEWTSDGQMRQPSFEGLREDKAARNVRRELAQPAAQVFARPKPKPFQIVSGEGKRRAKKSRASGPNLRLVTPDETLTPSGKRVALTHLKKVFWPEEGYTKGDLIAYYRDIAPVILRYLKDRPLAIHRHPDGIKSEGFFQKSAGAMCQDEPTLLYLANLGCIEMNPWLSRMGHIDYPDYLVLDLDPLEIGFDRVIETALAARSLFDELGAASFAKTSGSTGMHVFVPLGARYHYDQARRFAELAAHLIQQRLPEITSVLRSPAQRRKRVYLDFLQNHRGHTMVAPYSVRPRPHATVSAPLDWREVRRGLDPTAFNIKTMRKRLDKVGDLWEPVLEDGIDLKSCLERLTRLKPTG